MLCIHVSAHRKPLPGANWHQGKEERDRALRAVGRSLLSKLIKTAIARRSFSGPRGCSLVGSKYVLVLNSSVDSRAQSIMHATSKKSAA